MKGYAESCLRQKFPAGCGSSYLAWISPKSANSPGQVGLRRNFRPVLLIYMRSRYEEEMQYGDSVSFELERLNVHDPYVSEDLDTIDFCDRECQCIGLSPASKIYRADGFAFGLRPDFAQRFRGGWFLYGFCKRASCGEHLAMGVSDTSSSMTSWTWTSWESAGRSYLPPIAEGAVDACDRPPDGIP